MIRSDEFELFSSIATSEILTIDSAAIVAAKDRTGPFLLLAMIGPDGKRYSVPLGRDLALSIGEQLVRAVDAIDAGLATLQDQPP